MYCRICGDENGVKYYPSKKNVLCPACAKDTPRKASFDRFNKVYFRSDHNCPPAIRKEFYDDYKASTHNLREYVKATVSTI